MAPAIPAKGHMILPASAPASGWEASLVLRFGMPTPGRTVLGERTHVGPLRIQKPLYPEGDAVCHAIIVHPPGGIAGGDTLGIRIDLEAQTHGLITTPGATKWYRARADTQASQSVRIQLAPDAVLEWLPQEAIVFNAAQANNDTRIVLEDNALYLGWEVLCFGRAAHGETFRNGRYRQRLTISRHQRMLWNERGHLMAEGRLMHSPIGLAGRSVAGTLLAAGREISPALLEAAREAVAGHAGASRIALTRLPQALAARYLGDSSEEAKELFVALWRVLRPALTGRAAVLPRLWAT